MAAQGAFGGSGAFGAFGGSGAFGAFGGAGAFGAFGGSGAFGAFGAFGSPAAVDPQALIAHRDGIVGSWVNPSTYPMQLPQEAPGIPVNFGRWEPWVRAAMVQFELGSRLLFAPETVSGAAGFTLWDAGVSGFGSSPTATAQRIVHLCRPPDDHNAAGVQVGYFWQKQLEWVSNWADLRAERCGEILSQLGSPLAFWVSVLGLDAQRHKWTLEIIAAALGLANTVEMRFKHALACRRPVEMSPQLQPMIATPGHGSVPSGHATEAHIVAFVLWKLLRAANPAKPIEWFEQLMRQAARVAINRTIAGVHFPVDSAAGQVLGLALGEYFFHRADIAAQASYTSWEFIGTGYFAAQDFDWRLQWLIGDQRNPLTGFSKSISGNETSAAATFLHQLWTDAVKEWM